MTAPPSPPVRGGHPAHHSGTGNHPITRVVIHSAVMDCQPGAAELLAKWNREGTTAGSWHYAVDPTATLQCSFDRYVCWHAPPNGHSIGIEMADRPSSISGARWLTLNQRRTLRRTAKLTAELCVAYELPLVLLNVEALRAGRKGIATHATVSAAFGQSSHWDPGKWPADKFLRMVRKYANTIKENNP